MPELTRTMFLDRVRGLCHRERRERDRLYYVEGLQGLQAALAAGVTPCHVLITEASLKNLSPDGLPEGVVTLLSRQEISTVSKVKLDDEVITVLPAESADLDTLRTTCQRLVLLEDVGDPSNLAVILRTAECLGWDGVVVLGQGVDPWNPRVARASMGSLHHLALGVFPDSQVFISQLQENGWTVAAAVVQGGSDPRTTELPTPLAVLAGNEPRGLRPETIAQADCLLTISQAGKTDSLNVAQAVGMLCYQYGYRCEQEKVDGI